MMASTHPPAGFRGGGDGKGKAVCFPSWAMVWRWRWSNTRRCSYARRGDGKGKARARMLAVAAAALAVLASVGAGDDDDGVRVRQQQPPVVRGLSFDFYRRSCPRAESVVRDFVRDAVRRDVGLAAGLLRLHFHDCFVQGCDASVLLDGSATGPGEKRAPPNLTLRPSAFKAINDIRDRLEKACGGPVVSCSDILALAARDSVVASGGPEYKVPLGRRDSTSFATTQDVLGGLPAPSAKVPALLAVLRKINLDATDLVALSGGYTIGLAHRTSFDDRLFPRQDPTMNASFAGRPKQTCPAKGTDRRTVLDVRTPNVFDNKYYVNLVNREGLFVSDQDLFTDAATKPAVARFVQSHRNCSARNPGTTGDDDDDGRLPWSIVVEAAAETLGL